MTGELIVGCENFHSLLDASRSNFCQFTGSVTWRKTKLCLTRCQREIFGGRIFVGTNFWELVFDHKIVKFFLYTVYTVECWYECFSNLFSFLFFFPTISPQFLLSLLPTSGDGKTHYIQQQLACSPASLTVSVNEAFTPLNAISKLRMLPLNQNNCAIFFNFTMLPPGVRRWVKDGGGEGVREVEGEGGGGWGRWRVREVKGEGSGG